MARRVFFSFHYQSDVHRAHVVRNSWVTKSDRTDAGFFDASVFEDRKRSNVATLKQFLTDGMNGSSVTCVLTGSQTAYRRWVRYELLQSFINGRGLLAIAINAISNLQKQTTPRGVNPLSCLGGEIRDQKLFFKEYDGTKWVWSQDVQSMSLSNIRYNLGRSENFTFDQLFQNYDWVAGVGYENMPGWVETAAKFAGR